MALDEADRGTKARYAAVTFNKTKPYKYVLRFYAVVGYMYQYCPSLWDYGRANKTGQSKATRYCSTHREMRGDTPLMKVTLLLNVLIQVLCG